MYQCSCKKQTNKQKNKQQNKNNNSNKNPLKKKAFCYSATVISLKNTFLLPQENQCRKEEE